jgi:hypothetical protein
MILINGMNPRVSSGILYAASSKESDPGSLVRRSGRIGGLNEKKRGHTGLQLEECEHKGAIEPQKAQLLGSED